MDKTILNTKKSSNYADKGETKSCSLCNVRLKETERDCPLCLSYLMTSIKNGFHDNFNLVKMGILILSFLEQLLFTQD